MWIIGVCIIVCGLIIDRGLTLVANAIRGLKP